MSKKQSKPKPFSQPGETTLRFLPDAWAKLLYFRDRKDVEIGGFGITDPADPLLIREFVTVKQTNTVVTVSFDDKAVAEFFEDQVDQGRRPSQFGRIWLHTHPGDSPLPSSVDEETFERVFGACDWTVMFIVSRTGKTYARLRFNVGPGGSAQLPVQIDYNHEFAGSDHSAWAKEFDVHVDEVKPSCTRTGKSTVDESIFSDDLLDPFDRDHSADDLFNFDFTESEVIHRW